MRTKAVNLKSLVVEALFVVVEALTNLGFLLAFWLSSCKEFLPYYEKLEEAGFQFEIISNIGNCVRRGLVAVEDVEEGGL